MYKISDTLPNRNVIIDVKESGDRVVYLCTIPLNRTTSYVTHLARRDAPGATFWGHYYRTLAEATRDFEERG